MKSMDATREESFHMEDPETIRVNTDYIKPILDAKYKSADLKEIISTEYNHLNDNKNK